jgi:hypothetical protein
VMRRSRQGQLFRGKRGDHFDETMLVVFPAPVECTEWVFRHVGMFLMTNGMTIAFNAGTLYICSLEQKF